MTTNEKSKKKSKLSTIIILMIMVALCFAVGGKALYSDISAIVEEKAEFRAEIEAKQEQGDKLILLERAGSSFNGTGYWIQLDRELEADGLFFMKDKSEWEELVEIAKIPKGSYGELINPDESFGFYSKSPQIIEPDEYLDAIDRGIKSSGWCYGIWINADGTVKQEVYYSEDGNKPYNQYEVNGRDWDKWFATFCS